MKYLKAFMSLFGGYTKAYGQYILGTVDESKHKMEGDARTSYETVQEINWKRHLSGEKIGLGVVPLMDDNKSIRWACIDVDIYQDINYKTFEAKIKELPAVMTLSKSGGIHLWFFFKEPVNAAAVSVKLKSLAAFLGLAKHELFPKQATRASATDVGNWINLPYFGDTRKGFLNGKQIGLAAFLKHAETKKTTLEQFIKLNVGAQGKDFKDGPPCLQQLTFMGIPELYNNTMLNIGLYFRAKDISTWQTNLMDFNKRWPEPMPATKMQALADSISKNSYTYTCAKPPLCDYCNFKQCQTREFGINIFKGKIPIVIDSVTKYDSTPPIWVLEIEGKRIQINNPSQIAAPGAFNNILLSNINRLMPPVKLAAWSEYINTVMENKLTIVPAPLDASHQGQLLGLVDAYLSNRAVFGEDSQEQIINGSVWVDEGRTAYFQSGAFMRYLKMEGFTALSLAEVWAVLNHAGATNGDMKIKGRKIKFWTYPAKNLQTEAFNVPNYEEKDNY